MITRRTALTGMSAAGLAFASPQAMAEDNLQDLFEALIFADSDEYASTLEVLRARGGEDLAPGLIFALRFTQQNRAPLVALLSDLTGETGARDWFDWMLWQEAHPEIVPHPSYIDLKRELYFRIDRNFEVFLKPEYLDRDRMKIRFEEITWGGVRKDGIPSLDSPDLIPAKEADYLLGSDLVFGVAINGDVRAYPLRIMGWHEMFNDVIGGVPLALAYCTLCGSGILFETQLPGRDTPLVFGSSGFLYRSNKLMFDRGTHSLWNQFTGEPVMGPLVDSGIALAQRPVVIEPWAQWSARHPDSKVLSLDTGHVRDYRSGVVYRDYFGSPDLMFPAQVDETRLRQKDYVFGIRTFGGAKAWPVTAFSGGQVINDTVGNLNVVLIGDPAGRTVRAYDRGALSFAPGSKDDELVADGAVWSIGEEGLTGPSGAQAPRVAGHIAYWFAWDGYLGARSELYQG
ncbi:MAG: DUF3179 domain-containing protein [Pseudomonadota bacterium]